MIGQTYLVMRASDGTFIKRLDNFTSLDYSFAERQVGEATLVIDESHLPRALLHVDNIFEIYHDYGAGPLLEAERVWYLQKIDSSLHGNELRMVHTLTMQDAVTILNRPIVAYYAESAQASKTDYADDMCKDIIRENIGASAGAGRDFSSYITVAADTASAPSQSKAFAHRQVLDVLTELCEQSLASGTYLTFDVVYVSSGVNQFITYTGQRGVDHGSSSGAPLRLSCTTGSLADAVMSTDYRDLRNVVYAGGQGQNEAREIVAASDATSIAASVINRREMFVNASQTAVTAEVTGEANAALKENRAKTTLDATFKETRSLRYGIEINFGDLVVAEFGSYSLDVHIDAVRISEASGKRTLDIKVHGEAVT